MATVTNWKMIRESLQAKKQVRDPKDKSEIVSRQESHLIPAQDQILSAGSIRKLSQALAELPPAKLETKHYWANGMYVRELFLPTGTVAVGKIHKAEHLFMVVAGKVVLVHEGGAPVTVAPPFVIVSAPGTRRAAYAITDTTMVTVQRTDLRDLQEIERELIEDDPGAALDWENKLKVPCRHDERTIQVDGRASLE